MKSIGPGYANDSAGASSRTATNDDMTRRQMLVQAAQPRLVPGQKFIRTAMSDENSNRIFKNSLPLMNTLHAKLVHARMNNE